MTMEIKKAVRQQKKIRISIAGVSGAGKTNTSLELATGLANGGKILLIDSEHGRAALFADDYDFDTIELQNLDLESYLKALALGRGDYAVVIVDSGSHAWDSVNEKVQEAATRSQRGNSFEQWGKVGNPLYQKFVQTIVTHPAHVIVTLRSKADYVMEEYTTAGGKTATRPKKVGMAAKFREGGEYEFDIAATMDLDNNLIVEKSPPGLQLQGKVINKPTRALGGAIALWLNSGAVKTEPVATGAEAAKGFLKPLTENGVDPAPQFPPYAGNPWLHIIEGEGNPQRGIPLCLISDPEGKWWKVANGQKVPKKSFTAADISAVQKILNQDDEFNKTQIAEARETYSDREIEA